MNPVTDSDFEVKALRADKPVLVDFWAEWCGPCRAVHPLLAEIAEERADDFSIFSLDIDANPEAAVRFGIRSIPTLILFRNGEEIARIMGAQPKLRIIEQIDSALAR